MRPSPRRMPRRAPLARLAANKARSVGPLRTAPASSEAAEKLDEDGAAKDGHSLASTTSIGFNTSLYRALRTPGPLMEWAAVQELEVLEAKSLEEERQRKLAQQRKQHLAELEAQRQQLLKAKEERRELRQRWREEAEADAQRFHAEEAAKKQRVFEVRRQFDEERRQAMEEERRRQEARQKAEFREGQEILRNAMAERQKAERKESERREKERSQALRMINEADLARQEKARRQEEEYKNDMLMAQKQQELLERQEAERAAFFQKMKDKQQKMLAAYEAGVGNEMERKQREDEDRARKYQMLAEEKDKRQMELKEQRMKDLKKASQEHIQAQLQEHALRKKQAKEDEIQLLRRLQAQDAELAAKEKAKVDAKLQARKANAEQLREQIKLKNDQVPSRVARDQMNEVEKQMNKARLDRILTARQELQSKPSEESKKALTAR